MNREPDFRRGAGFSLVEVTLALGIAAFCLVAILGMLPLGLNTSQNAVSQTAAVSVLRAVAADLRDTPVGVPVGTAMTSTYYKLTVPVPTGAGTTIYLDEGGAVVTQTQARFKMTISTISTPTAPARNATREHVLISWPPQAAKPSGTLESIVALDRN